jgi:hypothetical protein
MTPHHMISHMAGLSRDLLYIGLLGPIQGEGVEGLTCEKHLGWDEEGRIHTPSFFCQKKDSDQPNHRSMPLKLLCTFFGPVHAMPIKAMHFYAIYANAVHAHPCYACQCLERLASCPWHASPRNASLLHTYDGSIINVSMS